MKSGISVLGVAAAVALLGGCATDVPRRDRGVFVGNQGGAWEAILPPQREGAEPDVLAAAPEYGRRDEALGVAVGPHLPADAWPDASPRLENLRRYTFSTQAETFTFYSNRPAPRRVYGHNAVWWP